MKNWKITDTNGAPSFAVTEDNQTPADVGYDDVRYNWTEIPTEPDEVDSIKGAVENDTVAAEDKAREIIIEEAANAAAALVPDPRRQMTIFFMWYEVQRLKMAMALNQVPNDLEERRHQYPMIMALSYLSGEQPIDVATAIETRYWNRVKDIALFEAKTILAHDAVAQAATPHEKIDVAKSVDWSGMME